MKASKLLFVSFFLIFSALLYAQDIGVHKMIGKSKSEVTKTYGKPVHQDNSNPDMVCMFYQTSTKRMIFVSDKNEVYQSEATATYDNEAKARGEVDKLITGSISDGFAVDTISTNDFQLHKAGVKADLQLSENKISNKFELSLKARKSED